MVLVLFLGMTLFPSLMPIGLAAMFVGVSV